MNGQRTVSSSLFSCITCCCCLVLTMNCFFIFFNAYVLRLSLPRCTYHARQTRSLKNPSTPATMSKQHCRMVQSRTLLRHRCWCGRALRLVHTGRGALRRGVLRCITVGLCCGENHATSARQRNAAQRIRCKRTTTLHVAV